MLSILKKQTEKNLILIIDVGISIDIR